MRKTAVTVVAFFALFASFSLFAATDQEYVLLPGAAVTIPVDQTINLGIITIDANGGWHDVDILQGLEWTMNGKVGEDPSEGKLAVQLGLLRATYKAPHTVPKVNPVAIAVTILPQGPIKSKLTLICKVTVVEQVNMFNVTGPHQAFGLYQLDDRFSAPQVQAMLARAYMAGPELAINVGAMQPGGAGGGEMYHGTGTMSLLVNGTSIGEHQWTLPGSSATTVQLTIAGGSGIEMYSTGDCLPHGDNNCKPVSTKGTTRITAFDNKTNEVSGSFQGQVVKLVNGKPSSYAQAFGSFKTKLQALVPGPN